MHPVIWLAATVFAVYRLSELIAHDEIAEPARRWLGRKAASDRKVWVFFAKLSSCPLCIGTWISAGASYLYSIWVVDLGLIELVVMWLAISGAQYFLSVQSLDDN
jgi:hypothetical protein